MEERNIRSGYGSTNTNNTSSIIDDQYLPSMNIIDPETFEYQDYSESDENLISFADVDTSFSSSIDVIEYFIYTEDKNLIYPSQKAITLRNFDVIEGDVLIDPPKNLKDIGFDRGTFNIIYNFYRKRLASNNAEYYFISEISSDRTEIKLDSNVIPNNLIISSSNEFINYRENSEFFVDFYLNFGHNKTVIANNLSLQIEEDEDPTLLVKLYEPLPTEFSLKDELWVVELLSEPQAYQVNFPIIPEPIDDFTYIAGPNFNLEVLQETGQSGDSFSIDTLFQSDITSSVSQIQSLLNEKGINININYENYGNFVNFSSAKTRLENFYYKASLIESASNQLGGFLDTITSDTTNTIFYSESKATLTGQINNIIKNFDGYEYFLYFNSGSQFSWPKKNTEPPFILFETGSTEVKNWIGSADPTNAYYGGQALSASNYDQNNKDYLFWTIPEFLRDDPQNLRYELFVDMVGQYYDNIWVYTKDLTNKFDGDNRLDFGISKDLVADAIRDFSVKLYSSGFNTDDLFTTFLGLTPSGSLFPVNNITGSLPVTTTGSEYVNTKISGSNEIVPLNDVQKQLYKRIYHNIPYLLKTKGTIAGIRALITSYGIPDTILRINQFGGKDRNEAQDYDLKQNVFNFAYDTGTDANNFLTSSFQPNATWNPSGTAISNGSPNTVQFRFKSAGIPTASNNVASSDIRYSQSLWMADRTDNTFSQLGTAIVLEYTGSGFVSGSYSGSVASPYDTWGTLKFFPNANLSSSFSCSVFAPFFNKDWWSVQVTFTGSAALATASLFSANEIDGKVGFSGSDTQFFMDERDWYRSLDAALNHNTTKVINGDKYVPFSGSYQEYRMFIPRISESKFFDYTVNPYSVEGNSVNSTPNELMFRADLGTELNTGSRTSIHPRVTGSAIQITQSFNNDTSDFYTLSSLFPFVNNVENIYQDQVLAGIKNRVTDKIQVENNILPEAPYGFQTPTSSTATQGDTNITTLSTFQSIQQTSPVSQSYTPNVNYLEVGFSPSDQIDDDINAQIGYVNIGDYIGDPRFQSSSAYTYPRLDELRDAYFEKYITGYDVKDFVRLIKFFDNSLFKMIKDFTPARTSLASGVIVKQHLLERNRLRPAQVTSSFLDYSGSIRPFPKDYITGSRDFPMYSDSGSAVYKFSGGPGGSFNRFNGIQTYNLSYLAITSSNLVNSITSNTLNLPGGGDDFDFFGASGSSQVYGETIVEVGQLVGSNDAGVLTVTDLLIEDNPRAEIGDTITINGSDLEGAGSGQLIVTLQPQDLFSVNIQSPNNRFFLTQSWSESFDNSVLNSLLFNQSSSQYISASYLGPRNVLHSDQSEFYDGIFSGSEMIVATQSLNAHCEVYLNVADNDLVYDPIFFSFTTGQRQGTVTEDTYLDQRNVPVAGDAWIVSRQISDVGGGTDEVKFIKIAKFDKNGIEVGNYLEIGTDIRFLFTDAAASGISDASGNSRAVIYNIIGATQFQDHTLLSISPSTGDSTFASSSMGGSENWSMQANSNTFNTLNTINTESADIVQQGVFLNPNQTIQSQNFYYYNLPGLGNTLIDPLEFFNVGQEAEEAPENRTYVERSTQDINGLLLGCYTPTRTSNIPWVFSGSIQLSASDLGDGSGGGGGFTQVTSSDNLLHSGSRYQGFNLVTQDREGIGDLGPLTEIISLVDPTSGSFTFIPSPNEIGTLSSTIFTSSYNTQIPGNQSGSLGQDGGHPKIGLPGTASIDFHFPKLTISGSIPVSLGRPVRTPLSGSGTNTSNRDFNNATSVFTQAFPIIDAGIGCATYYTSSTSHEEDGALAFNWSQQTNLGPNNNATGFANLVEQNNNFIIVDNISELTLFMDMYITASAPFTASLQYKFFSSSYEDESYQGWEDNLGSEDFKSDNGIGGNGGFNLNFTNKQFNLSGVELPTTDRADLVTDGEGVQFRWVLRGTDGFDGLINYQISRFIIDASVDYVIIDESGGGASPGGTQTYISNDIFKCNPSSITPTNSTSTGNAAPWQPSMTGFPSRNQLTSSAVVPTNKGTILGQVHLKRTGSNYDAAGNRLDTYDLIITSSQQRSFDITDGAVFEFPDSPITDIFNPVIVDLADDSTTGSTINQHNDMYYIEYSMSQFSSGSAQSQEVKFLPDSDLNSKIIIDQAYFIPAGGTDFKFSGSFQILKATENDTNLGLPVASQQFHLENSESIQNFVYSMSYDGPYAVNDRFTLNIVTDKNLLSGAVVNNYSFRIMPSQSIWSPLTTPSAVNNYREPTDTQTIIPTFFGSNVIPFPLAVNCQPTLNNFIDQRLNTYIMDVDYTNPVNNPLIPVNQELILENKAVRAAVPDSNYSSLGWLTNRYLGARSTSQQINIYSYGDTGGFGSYPNVEINYAFFGYFNSISNPYPIINDTIRLNLTNLIDEQGNATPPSLSPTSRNTFKNVFPIGGDSSISVNSGSEALKDIEGDTNILAVGDFPVPICYSQTSSNQYTEELPLSGSGRISIYDNPGNASARVFYAMSVMGTTGSVYDDLNFPNRFFSTTLKPNGSITTASFYSGPSGNYDIGNAIYTSSGADAGKFTFKGDSIDTTIGDDLANPQRIDAEIKFATNFIYESGTDELVMKLRCVSGSTNIPFDLEDLELATYYLGKKVDLGSILGNVPGASWREGIGVVFVGKKAVTTTRKRRGRTTTTTKYKQTEDKNFFLNENNECVFMVENPVINEILTNRGIAWKKQGGIERGGPISAMEFTLKVTTGDYQFKVGDQISFELEGEARDSKGSDKQTVFYPSTAPPEVQVLPVNYTVQGAFDTQDGDNTASAPYWYYSSSAGVDFKNILQMSSSNFNEAYGTGFQQGDLIYVPGPSQFFPGGQEPLGTKFDNIQNNLEIKVGDEIRFVNNETYAYSIIEVTNPAENIVTDVHGQQVGQVKIKIDGEVPTSINKDFFLVRRPVPNANSVYVANNFPQANLILPSQPSGSTISTSGILYPSYPTEYLINSASQIVSDLISQGVIEP